MALASGDFSPDDPGRYASLIDAVLGYDRFMVAADGVSLPFVEVHVTNVHAREPERRHSMLAQGARAVLCGFGAAGYELALRGLAAVAPRG